MGYLRQRLSELTQMAQNPNCSSTEVLSDVDKCLVRQVTRYRTRFSEETILKLKGLLQTGKFGVE